VGGGGEAIRHPAGTPEILIRPSLYFPSADRLLWFSVQTISATISSILAKPVMGYWGAVGLGFKGKTHTHTHTSTPSPSAPPAHSVPILFEALVVYCANSSTVWYHYGVGGVCRCIRFHGNVRALTRERARVDPCLCVCAATKPTSESKEKKKQKKARKHRWILTTASPILKEGDVF